MSFKAENKLARAIAPESMAVERSSTLSATSSLALKDFFQLVCLLQKFLTSCSPPLFLEQITVTSVLTI